MIRIDRRAWVGLLFVGVAVSASPASAGKVFKPGGVVLPDGLPPKVLEPDPNLPPQQNPPQQNPPQAKGWPHSILSATSVDCSRDPTANEVIVATNPNFAGRCASLTPGLYPYSDNLVVGNDAISSIKVGSGVRARVYKDPGYGGGWNHFGAGTRRAGGGGFNDKISSIRVEPDNRSQSCDDLREGEIALFEHPQLRGDCMVLPGEGSYPNADVMGIKNDSISSIRNNSSKRLLTFWHPNMSQHSLVVEPHSHVDSMSTGGLFTTGINDNISSIQMQ